MCDDHCRQCEDMPGALDHFLAQILNNTPEFFPTPTTGVSTSSSSYTASPEYSALDPRPICQWVLTQGAPIVCGAPLPLDPKLACAHFRSTHDVRGNEKVIVSCRWRDCQVPPMQRGSMIRHLLSVHLSLLRWKCETCGKWFSRKGTGHACIDVE